jgi:hypothetical protein
MQTMLMPAGRKLKGFSNNGGTGGGAAAAGSASSGGGGGNGGNDDHGNNGGDNNRGDHNRGTLHDNCSATGSQRPCQRPVLVQSARRGAQPPCMYSRVSAQLCQSKLADAGTAVLVTCAWFSLNRAPGFDAGSSSAAAAAAAAGGGRGGGQNFGGGGGGGSGSAAAAAAAASSSDGACMLR